MTNRRVMLPRRRLRFRIHGGRWKAVDPRDEPLNALEFSFRDQDWEAVRRASGVPRLNAAQKAEGSRVCLLYMEEIEDHRRGLPEKRFLQLTAAELKALGWGGMPAHEALRDASPSRTPQGCFALLVNGLGALFEDISGRRRTARNDHTDLGSYAPFVRFVFAIWCLLPTGAERTRNLTSMSAASNAAFRRWSRSPTFENEKISE